MMQSGVLPCWLPGDTPASKGIRAYAGGQQHPHGRLNQRAPSNSMHLPACKHATQA